MLREKRQSTAATTDLWPQGARAWPGITAPGGSPALQSDALVMSVS